MIRVFYSEWIKLRRWSLLAGGGVMIAATCGIAYLTFHQIASGATGPEMTKLIHAFPTPQGLLAILGQARSLIIAIALVIVTVDLAGEWSGGTVRNLLVREPRRLHWLAGKMAALMLFVLLSLVLTLFIAGALILAIAHAQGVATAAWTSPEALRIFWRFLGNEVLCLVGISMLGMLIALLTRSVGAAVGIALAYVLIPEGIVAVVWLQGSQWLPVRVFNYIVGATLPAVGPTPPQGYGAALLVALGWIVLFITLSAWLFPRQDVTA